MTFASLSIICFLSAIGVLTHRMLVKQHEITAAQERRHQSYLLADELRQSSDDLTRLARTYVVTGDQRYEDGYWAVLNIRNGKAPRPEHYERIYWDFMAASDVKPRPDGKAVPLQQLMEEQGFTAEEFAKLKEAQANSDALVHMETVAMNAVKGLFDDGSGQFTKKGAPDMALACQMMHGREYHAEKAKIMKPIDEFLAILDQRTRAEVQSLTNRIYKLFYALLAVVGSAILLLLVLYVSIYSTVIKPIQRMMGELSNASGQLEAASAQLSHSSQTLAAGASEQASSVEETSSSLEEVSSMIQATAENAQKAKLLASETRAVEEGGSRTMAELVGAMKDIDTSTAQVAKIVKDIDEIAFQTNILALNAAVEAARAGEAGAGFAVVADEVRSLAQRSAAAAKETARKIELAIDSSRKGAQCTARVGESLGQITRKVADTDALVGEIATAAHEQARGIEQITLALEQIDKVSQANAANAEGTAAAAEQVEAQGEALNRLVGQLQKLAGGRSGGPAAPGGQSGMSFRVFSEMDAARPGRSPVDTKAQLRNAARKKLASGAADHDRDFLNF